MATISAKEFLKGGKPTVVSGFSQTTQKTQGFLERASSALSERGKDIKSTLGDAALGKISPLETGVRVVGDTIGGATDVLGAAAQPAIESVAQSGAGQYILNSSIGKAGIKAIEGGVETYVDWKKKNPRAAESLEAVVNIASIFPAAKLADLGVDVAKGIGSKAVQTASEIASAAKPIVKGTENLARGLSEGARGFAANVSGAPERIAVNAAEKSAKRATIDSLPTQTAKSAAKNGIEISDIQEIYRIPKNEKAAIKKLVDTSIKFANGDKKVDPMELVGSVLVKRVKEADKVKHSIGQKLGVVAKNLPNVSQEEIVTPVFERLRKVQGLTGLEIKNGKLDFSNTSLSSALSKADRKAISSAFSEAIKSSSGTKKHLFRQELFEIIGGKKKGGVALTDTQDKAFEAIRAGLSDVLESKNSKYKILSKEYREAIRPTNELKNLLKDVLGADEDVLNLKGGLLARRLTSNVQSRPKITQALRDIDTLLKKNKKAVPLDTARLQNIFNILDKYLNISGDTTLKGQVSQAIGGGVKDKIIGAVGDLAGTTDAVKREKLIQILTESLR